MSIEKRCRYPGFDLLRGIAAFFIVGCHLQIAGTAPARAALYFCNLGVAVFATVSGFLLASSVENADDYRRPLYSRVKRLLPPYVFWSAFYLGASVLFAALVGKPANWHGYADIGRWMGIVFRGYSSCHLWYLASLLHFSFAVSCLVWLDRRVMSFKWGWLALGAAFVFLSSKYQSHVCVYDLRFWGFGFLGLGLYGLSKTYYLGKTLLCCFVALALIVHMACASFFHPFIRDMLVVLPLVLLAATTIQETVIGHVLKGWSFGVYLWHPFFAAGFAALANRYVSKPHGLAVVLIDWLACYGLAVAGTVGMNKLFKRRKLV